MSERANTHVDTQSNTAVSDYERIGGAPTVGAIVQRFYELVPADPELAERVGDTPAATEKDIVSASMR